MVVKFVDILHFTINDLKLGMYLLKITYLCRNMLEESDYCITYSKCILLVLKWK